MLRNDRAHAPPFAIAWVIVIVVVIVLASAHSWNECFFFFFFFFLSQFELFAYLMANADDTTLRAMSPLTPLLHSTHAL